MSSKTKFLSSLALGAAALTIVSIADEAHARKGFEKCYGIVKAGKNGCGNAQGTHSCAGQSTVEGDWGEWRVVKKGKWEKIVGGNLEPKKPS